MVATYVTAWLRAVTLELAPSELRLSDCALTGQRRWSVVMPGPRGCMVICEACALRYCCRCHLSAVDNPWGEGIYGLNEREDEAINEKHVMENVKASQALKQKCTNENFEVIDLDELLNHLNATNAIVTRNKLHNPLNTIQQNAVQHEFQQLQNNVTLFMKQCLREQANSS